MRGTQRGNIGAYRGDNIGALKAAQKGAKLTVF
jgi:hypothetical protein